MFCCWNNAIPRQWIPVIFVLYKHLIYIEGISIGTGMFKGLILVLHPWHRVRVVGIDIKFPKAFYEFNKSDLVEEELYDAWWKWNKINRIVCVCVCVYCNGGRRVAENFIAFVLRWKIPLKPVTVYRSFIKLHWNITSSKKAISEFIKIWGPLSNTNLKRFFYFINLIGCKELWWLSYLFPTSELALLLQLGFPFLRTM